ncbi:MAG TPA: NAD-binding protein [Solirubrobacteraceae bacterium]|nr:NAD-binding protein [Solirubrobacteraceae bacterium]
MCADEPREDPDAAQQPVVVLIGDGDLANETAQALEAANARVIRLCRPDEDEVRDVLEGEGVDSVAVVEREDAIVLRFALMVRVVSEDVPLLLTIFDPTMAGQVAEVVPNTRLTSLADIVAPSLAGPCIDERFTAVSMNGGKPVGLVERDDDVSEVPIRSPRPRRVEALARALFTPYDTSAGMLLFGAIGLAAVFALETVTAVFTLDESAVDAIYGSAKTLVTVDPNPKVAEGPDWYKLFTSVTMVVALLLAAAFTAGLVNRFVERRLTGLVGRNVVPRRDHVVVVGLGQVGMRLCLLLRACKIPLVAVEADENGERVGIAKELGLPVVIGRGGDPSLMRRLSLPRARAVAAVTADDLENISVAMTARGIHPDIRTVLRVGDGRIANETRSLLALGLIRDVHRLAAMLLAAKILGRDAVSVVCVDDDAHLRFSDGRLERAELDALAE